jgi:hypothetical protein
MNPHVDYAPFVVLRNKELRDFQWRASAFATVHSLRHSGEDKWARISGRYFLPGALAPSFELS